MAIRDLGAMPAPTGLNSLGAMLLGASERYRSEARADRALEDERAYRRSERREEREYEETRGQRQRTERLEDDLKQVQQRAREAGIQALVNEGVLKDADRNNPQAVATALETATKMGIIEKYRDLIEGGFLRAEDAGDINKRNLALNAFGKVASDKRTRETDLQTRGDTMATDTAARLKAAEQEEQEVLGRLRELEQVVSSGGMPSPAEVQREALMRAQAAVPGRRPSQIPTEEIQQLIPRVTEDLRLNRLDLAAQQQGILQRQLESVRNLRSSLMSQQNVQINRGALPSAVAPAAASPAQPPPLMLRRQAAPSNVGPSVRRPVMSFVDSLRSTLPPGGAVVPPPPTPEPPRVNPMFTPQFWGVPQQPVGRPITPSADIFPSTPPLWRTTR